MALSHELISQFAKLVANKDKQQTATTVYGTVETKDNVKYVTLDGSDISIPIADGDTTVDANDGERVTVSIADHKALVTGNVSSPAARTGDVVLLARKVQADYAYFKKLLADEVTLGKLTAAEANIVSLIAKDAEIEDLIAGKITVTDLIATKIDANVVIADKAIVDKLKADNLDVLSLIADKAVIDDLIANNANLNSLEAKNAYLKFANVDFANIGEAAVKELFAQSGIIKELATGDAVITGELVGVKISGDLIKANTLMAEKLVVRGSDGNYYALNTDFSAMPGVEPVEEDAIHGSTIVTNSITAEKVNVHDLVAFGATIGHFHIDEEAGGYEESDYIASLDESGYDSNFISGAGYYVVKTSTHDPESMDSNLTFTDGSSCSFWNSHEAEIHVGDTIYLDDMNCLYFATPQLGSLYSGVKSSVDNTTEGIYMDSTGQFNVGNGSNYLKFFKDQNGEWKLEISLGSKTVEETIADEVDKVQIGGRNLLLNSSFKESINEWETVGDVLHEQKSVTGTHIIRADGISDKAPATVRLSSKNLFNPDSTYYNAYFRWWNAETGDELVYSYDSCSFPIPCLPNTTYTISHANDSNNIFRVGYVKVQESEFISALNSGSTIPLFAVQRKTTEKQLTITTGEDATYIFVQITLGQVENTKQSLQCEIGTAATEYTPYFPIGVSSDSTVTVCGKNLLDLSSVLGTTVTGNGATFTFGTDGSITVSGVPTEYTCCHRNSRFVLPKGIYTASIQGDIKNMQLALHVRSAASVTLASIRCYENQPITFDLNEYEGYDSIILEIHSNKSNVELSGTGYFQVEKGTTATEYEPYKEFISPIADENGIVTIDTPYSPSMTVVSDTAGVNIDMTYRLIGNEFSEKYGKPCLWLKHYVLDKEKSLYQSIAGKLEPDTQYTLSGWLLAENVTEGSSNFGLTFRHQGVSSDGTEFSYWSIPFETNAVTGSWKHVCLTFTTDSRSANPTSEDIYIYTRDLIGDVYICDLKLERGNRLTDWTPAPEDAETALADSSNDLMVEISKVSASIETTSKDITMKALESYATVSQLTEATAELKVSAGEIEGRVEKVETGEFDQVKVTGKNFKMDTEGFSVEDDNSTLKTTISDDGMVVASAATGEFKNVLTANSEGVKAKDLHANTYLIIGEGDGSSRFEDYKDHTRTACFWIGN